MKRTLSFKKEILYRLFKLWLTYRALCDLYLSVHRYKHKSRNGTHSEKRCQFLFLLNVHFVDIDLAVVLCRDCFKYRSKHLAGTTPVGVEIYQRGVVTQKHKITGIFLIIGYSLEELLFCQMNCCHNFLVV